MLMRKDGEVFFCECVICYSLSRIQFVRTIWCVIIHVTAVVQEIGSNSLNRNIIEIVTFYVVGRFDLYLKIANTQKLRGLTR